MIIWKIFGNSTPKLQTDTEICVNLHYFQYTSKDISEYPINAFIMKPDMFAQKTLKRLRQKIVLNDEQINAWKRWLKWLSEGKLESERKNYGNFQQFILQAILGYDVENIFPEENNVDVQIKNSENKVILCIETKGTSTHDLFAKQNRSKKEQETPIEQLWNYMSKNGSEYGMCTNYQKFILIQQGNDKYYEFDFSRSDNEESLKEFILIFSKYGISHVEKTLEESIKEEKEFTDEFYNLFHETRLLLIAEFQKNGIDLNRSVYFTQIILNRLTFIFFAEDKGFISTSNDKHKVLHDAIMNELKSSHISSNSHNVYACIEKLFYKLDDGSDPKIFGFNGGMFSGTIPKTIFFNDLRDKLFFDESIKLNSRLLQSMKLNEYDEQIIENIPNLNPIIYNILIMERFDFNIDIDISILGHIFEQSISDLEILIQTGGSERKEGGIYYTPDNIAKYICRNTIIPYLSKTNNVNRPKELVEEYYNNNELDMLEKKLAKLKILDPACGSGAFLVKIAETMYEIYDEIQSYRQMDNTLHGWSQDEKIRSIILDNIYGVDINGQSIDIAKLSLFFKIATKGKKLPYLAKNIRKGNSILPMNTLKPIDGAFDWKKNFPDIMDGGKGFDIIVGNPPYVRQELLSSVEKHRIKIPRKDVSAKMDLSGYFYFRSIQYLRDGGILSFISSDSWMHMGYGNALQQLFLENKIHSILKPNFNIFQDADTKPAIIIIEKNSKNTDHVVNLIHANNESDLIKMNPDNIKQKRQQDFEIENWNKYFDNDELEINISTIAIDMIGKIKRGITTGANKFFVINAEIIKKYDIDKKYLIPVISNDIKGVDLHGVKPTQYLLNVNEPKGDLLKTTEGKNVWEYINEIGNTETIPKKGSNKTSCKLYELDTLAARTLWYSLNINEIPTILLARFAHGRMKIYENNDKFCAKDNYVIFSPHDKKYIKAYLAYFTSSYFTLLTEKNGHPHGGKSGGALQLLAGDWKKILVPDFTEQKTNYMKLIEAWDIYKKNLEIDPLDDVVLSMLFQINSSYDLKELKTKIRSEIKMHINRRRRLHAYIKEMKDLGSKIDDSV